MLKLHFVYLNINKYGKCSLNQLIIARINKKFGIKR
jgi:hypothetical protein